VFEDFLWDQYRSFISGEKEGCTEERFDRVFWNATKLIYFIEERGGRHCWMLDAVSRGVSRARIPVA
jgi:hypothetical protein